MIKNFIVIILSVITTAVSAQDPKESGVWKNVEALNTAIFINKDSAALEKLVNTKVTYGHSGGNIENKTEMIHKAVNNVTTYRDVTTQKISINIINNTAIVRHQLNAIQKDAEGKESDLHLSVLQVWMKENKAWQLVARQSAKVTN